MNQPLNYGDQVEFVDTVWDQLSTDPAADYLLLPGYSELLPTDIPYGEDAGIGQDIALISTIPLAGFTRTPEVDTADFVDRFGALPHAVIKIGSSCLLAVTEGPSSDRQNPYDEWGDDIVVVARPRRQVISLSHAGFILLGSFSKAEGDNVRREFVLADGEALERLHGIEDRYISSNHAVIGWGSGERTAVQDTSTNGTKIVGARGGLATLGDLLAEARNRRPR